MPRNRKRNRLYQPLIVPPAGTIFAGYARYSSDMQDGKTIDTQKRIVMQVAAQRGWVIPDDLWYEEPATSAKYDDIEKRPQFARLLREAGERFTGVLCYDSSRWSRNNAVTYASLDALRAKGVWWETADGLWNANRMIEDGHSIAFAVDASMNASYVVKLSKRQIDAKEERALGGWHQSRPPYGYLPPEYPPLPPGIGVNRKAAPVPVSPDYEGEWRALLLVRDLRCARRSCREIALALNLAGFQTRGNKWHGKHEPQLGETPRPRPFTEDTVWDMLHNPFYREYAPGCGKGTIITPSGQRVMGQHIAAWDWDSWHRMDEVARELRHAPQSTERKRETYPFAGIIVCATCDLAMRSMHTAKSDHTLRYHRCSASLRGLDCAASITTPAWRVERAFGQLLLRYRLGDTWHEDLRALEENEQPADNSDLTQQEARLHDEQESYNLMLLAKGIDAARYQRETARIQAALLTIARQRDTAQRDLAAALAAGEQIAELPELWEAARAHDDVEQMREMALALLQTAGLAWDGDLRAIVRLRPHLEYVPSLQLALHDWTWDGMWFHCPSPQKETSKQQRRIIRDPRTKTTIRREMPPQRFALSKEQQREALRLMNEGMSVRAIAKQFGVSHSAIWRLAHRTIDDDDLQYHR